MTAPSQDLLTYDPTALFLDGTGITRADFEALAPQLIRARQELLDSQASAFVHLPETVLSEYRANQRGSELGRMLRTARRIQDTVDRVIVLGIGNAYSAGRALMDACCDPHFNELTRGQRGSRPRMYFEGNSLDNDATQGLLRLLVESHRPDTVDHRWAIVVIATDDSALEPTVALRQYLGALRQTCGGDNSKVAQRVIPVTRSDSRLGELAKALGCPEIFRVPEGVDEHLTIFSAVGLLPSAILGLNVVSLLEGAQVMTAHFRNAPPGQNRVLDYAAACHVAGRRLGRTRRVLNVWAKALESTGHWVEHLLSGSQTTGITAVTTLHTRDLYGRGQPLRLGREALVTDLIVEQWRCDPLRVGPADFDYDGLAPIADKTVPELTAAAIRATKDAYRAHGLLHVDLRLPQLNEFFVGQLMQLLMLAAAVEVRLTGIHSGGSFGVQCHLQSAFPPGDPI